jgi:ketosteroid isomerase-like protein
MRFHRGAASLLGLAVLFVGCAPAAEEQAEAAVEEVGATQEDVVAAISQVREREIASVMAGDVDELPSGFTSDVVFMPPNAPLITGHDAVKEWAAAMNEQFEISGGYTDSEVTVAGDWAVERYRGAFTFTPRAGGDAAEETIKGIHIYQRQPDGSWLIAQDIWNSDAPLPLE